MWEKGRKKVKERERQEGKEEGRKKVRSKTEKEGIVY